LLRLAKTPPYTEAPLRVGRFAGKCIPRSCPGLAGRQPRAILVLAHMSARILYIDDSGKSEQLSLLREAPREWA